MAKQSKSSNRWLKEHFDDPYVKQSWQDGYRARAAYKLIELQQKYRFLKQGQIIIDLGAAPGSWSQVAARATGRNGKVIALDLLPMQPIENVKILQGDFTQASILCALKQELDFKDARSGADIILSDMAPNMSGNRTADQAQSMYLVEFVFEFAITHLKVGGTLATKVFQGRDLDQLMQIAKKYFNKIHFCKPDASRNRSTEHYLVCVGLKEGDMT